MDQAIFQDKNNVPNWGNNLRLDVILARLYPDYSRAQLQHMIRNGDVKINDQIIIKPKQPLKENDAIIINATLPDHTTWHAEPMALDILFEDEDLMIINKPSNLIVHPGAGIYEGTLVNGLLYHDPGLVHVPRAGLIHRLDKNTTGLLIIARNLKAHQSLTKQLANRTIKRHYQAIVHGKVIAGNTIDTPYGRHPLQRTKMAVLSDSKRQALTHYRVLKRFNKHSHIRIQLGTGRTHQIRVHMAYVHHPIVGDPTYGKQAPSNQLIARQALHAAMLTLQHPSSAKEISWSAALPNDMLNLLTSLEQQNATPT